MYESVLVSVEWFVIYEIVCVKTMKVNCTEIVSLLYEVLREKEVFLAQGKSIINPDCVGCV